MSDVTPFSAPNMDGAFAAAIAGHDTFYHFADRAVFFDTMNKAVRALKELIGQQALMLRCASSLKAEDVRKKSLEGLAVTLGDFAKASLQRPTGGGLSAFETAAASAALTDGKAWVLHVSIDQAGGSIINRKNLFTALGFPAMGLAGGLMAHYSVTDPTNGQIKTSAIIVCRTEKTSFDRVHSGTVDAHCRMRDTKNTNQASDTR